MTRHSQGTCYLLWFSEVKAVLKQPQRPPWEVVVVVMRGGYLDLGGLDAVCFSGRVALAMSPSCSPCLSFLKCQMRLMLSLQQEGREAKGQVPGWVSRN